MPVIWPSFISAAANTISSHQFTKPGGLATQSYETPKVGADQVNIFPPTPALANAVKPGNPLNANLATNPSQFTNIGNTNPLSGRYDFGVAIAQDYLDAVKGAAMTPVGATHTNNGAAEEFLKNGYGLVFERLLKEGDIPLMDQKDEDGNIVEMGKESHPDYADLCPEPIVPPDPIEEQKKIDKKFSKFINENKDNPKYDLYKFRFFQFHCLDGKESASDIIDLFANRLLQQFDKIGSLNGQFNYIRWATSLGKANYEDFVSNNYYYASSQWKQRFPYVNVETQVRNDIKNAGYNNWRQIVDGVSRVFKEAIDVAFPVYEVTVAASGNRSEYVYTENDLFKRLSLGRKAETPMPSPDLSEDVLCPLDEYKCQVSFNRERDLPQHESKRPRILTDSVIAFFSYDSSTIESVNQYSSGGNLGNLNLEEGEAPNIVLNDSNKILWWNKNNQYVKNEYVELEYERHWAKIPNAVSNISPNATDAKAVLDQFLEIDPKNGGTVFKFQYFQAEKSKEEAEACDEQEEGADINFTWPGGDPYEEMAAVTITYWYLCIVKPFAPSTPMPPALITAPLTGIYVPIYYGGKTRLANNLRRAWNSGKSFMIPPTKPPATVVATALAATYAMHLLEFKLLYLGGIPTPAGPVPMVGFVPVVF